MMFLSSKFYQLLQIIFNPLLFIDDISVNFKRLDTKMVQRQLGFRYYFS
ncbi:unnamed protein product [Paramecium sonneborni]|uniref:Uncharacterized protein n=1 Tax=Paramecium sonneborni TaxID=65129 RepID=A0A8S1R3S1_9CILI|nr:unnamed protein product [Paramecium sonneborni]